jgi:hypothetical protein
MGSFDRGFENALELRPDETIRWSGPAMHRVRRSWVGGRIYLSDQRLFFCPGVLVRGRHGVLRVPLSEVAGVAVLERKLAIASIGPGALRPRLCVSTAGGDEHAFSMQRFRTGAAELQSLLQTSR